jgi:hypothetical protein
MQKGVSLMIIAKSRTRFVTMVVSLILFIIISIITYHNSGLLHSLMQVDHSITQTVIPNWLEKFLKPFYFFSHGFGLFFMSFLIIFFLWGFKFKIPATWVLITNVGGFLIINIASLLFKSKINGVQVIYPAHSTFYMTLLISYFLLIIVPEIYRSSFQFMLQTILLLSWVATFITTILLPNYNLASALAGWLLALVWLQFSENGYRVYAPDFYRRKGFSNSWY